MSYLKRYAVRPRIDERKLLNRPGYHGDAFVRVYVEDTSMKQFRGAPPEPRVVLQIADCTSEIALAFELTSRGERENSLFKIATLLGALTRFRDALAAEAELYERRKLHLRRRAPRAA